MIQRLDSGAGVLLLTDAFGSTPSNIANHLSDGVATAVVAGVNCDAGEDLQLPATRIWRR